MSKRNHRKFRNQYRSDSQTHSQPVSHSPAPVSGRGDVQAVHAAEYKIIRNDMIRLVALNGFMLAAVIVLYYTNKNSGYLERLFERIF